jgi:hypothetical protein
MTGPVVLAIDRLDLTFAPKPWPFAVERRAGIEAHFAELKRRKPAVWNGRVLMMHEYDVRDGVFRGSYLETDFATFSAWRHWGEPAVGIADCFGAGALISSDGAALLGVMGEHTANAGAIYFPAGTPDPSDIIDGKVDLGWSVARELKEETGQDIAEFVPAPGWTTVIDGFLIMQVKTLRSRLAADELRARILTQLASEAQPELADIRIVRGRGDYDPAIPRFVAAFLDSHFDGELAKAANSA